MKNAIYLPSTLYEPTTWLAVAEDLFKEKLIVPKYFIYFNAESAELDNYDWSRDCFFHSHREAWKGLGKKNISKINQYDLDLSSKISYEEIISYKMMDRMDPTHGNFNFVHRQYFFRDYVTYWLDIIDELSIDIVISPTMPHRVYDFALYVASQVKGVKFISFQMTPFESNSLIAESVFKMPYKYHHSNNPGLTSYINPIISKRVSKVRMDYASAVPDSMVTQSENFKSGIIVSFISYLKNKLPNIGKYLFDYNIWSPLVRKGKTPEKSKHNILTLLSERVLNLYNIYKLKRTYADLVTSCLPEKYILVALHYQPEETSCPAGGLYSDQTLLVQKLLYTLPKDVNIVIKEHKTQFHPWYSGGAGRTVEFYNRLSSFSSRIYFASTDEDPFSLIDNSIAVATVTGTIGWEALVRGKPALIFGRAWYSGAPGVLDFTSCSFSEKDIAALCKGKLNPKANELDSYHAYLSTYLVDAIHDEQYNSMNRSHATPSYKSISSSISNYIKS